MDVIIPHRNSNSYRERNMRYVLGYYHEALPDSSIVLVEQDTETNIGKYDRVTHIRLSLGSEYFRKSSLINEGVRHTGSDKILMVDSDCILGRDALCRCTQDMGDSDVFTPFNSINFLNEGLTRQLIRNGKFVQDKPPPSMHINRYTGGAVCFTKNIFDDVGGFDDEILGWGREDDAFMAKCMRIGANVSRTKGNHELLHIFHPKENTKEYMGGERFLLNSEMLAAIKRMSKNDFFAYLKEKKEGRANSLLRLVEKYREMGKLKVNEVVRCGKGAIRMDTSTYTVIPDANGRVGLKEILDAAYRDDGASTLRFTIGLVEMACHDLLPKEVAILTKYKSMCEMA